MIAATLLGMAICQVSPAGGGPRLAFREVASESGLGFRFDTGSRGKHDLPEIMGGGVALIDFDGDGRLDIYLCNGGPIVPRSGLVDPPCRLFRNEGEGRFRDITVTSNAPGPSYAMGAAVGDYDGDGRDDLFVSGWRDQRLYRSLGGGRFEDVTTRAGITSHSWSTSAAFADLDGDGDLDLYVCNYLEFDPLKVPFCAAPDGSRDYCGPEEFSPQPDRLYRNDGDGTFTEVSRTSGILDEDGRGLGVLIADLVGDSRPDLFVANDGTACRLYENKGGLTFDDVAVRSGVAFGGDGRAISGMGVACGDVDGDGRADLLVSNFLGRSTVAFRNLGDGLFADDSRPIGLAEATRSVLGFGLGLVDFDGDGDLDLMQANGHVLDRERLGEPLAMRPLILRNDGRRFFDDSDRAGLAFSRRILGRGLAVGDLDGDGSPDAIIAALDAPALVLRNVSGGRFVTLDVVDHRGRPAVGATVRVEIDGRTIFHPVVSGGSYLSASDRRIVIGLRATGKIDDLRVLWSSGRYERFAAPKPGVVTRLQQGTSGP